MEEPNSWMVDDGKSYEMDDDWGYPHFMEAPICMCLSQLRRCGSTREKSLAVFFLISPIPFARPSGVHENFQVYI